MNVSVFLVFLYSMKFSADISLWYLMPIALIATALAYWMYSSKTNSWLRELSSKWKTLLIIMRASVLFLLAVLLFNIIFQHFYYKKEKPILVLGIDDSSSMLNYTDSITVHTNTKQFIDNCKEKLSEKYDIVAYSFSGIPNIIEDSITFLTDRTNLALALNQTKTEFYNRNLAGVVIISDGNYNTGANPIYSIDQFNTTSIFTLGVGDTIVKRDQLIKNIAHNDIAFFKNEFPIVVDIEGNKMGQTKSELYIQHKGKKIASEQIHFQNDHSEFKQVTFIISAQEPGIHTYTIHLQHAENEANYDNNSRTIYIEIIDTQSKVLLLSTAPNPDISALKSVWDKDQNLEIEFKLLEKWNGNIENTDLIVWHDPIRTTTQNQIKQIIENPVSKLFILGSQANASTIQQMNIGIELPSSNSLDDNEAKFNDGFNLFECSKDLKEAFNHYPPLKAKYGNVKIPKNSSVLTYQRIGAIAKNDPQIFFATSTTDKNKFKYGVIYGEGIWRWKLNEYARTNKVESFDELFSKIGQYLMVKQNTEPLRIHVPNNLTPNEEISIQATVLNATLQNIVSETVHFTLRSPNGKESKLQFGIVDSTYQLDLGKLPAGKYSWTAHCLISGKYHQKNGEFIVKQSFIEQAEVRANHELLQQMATLTDGSFHLLKNYDKLINELKNRKDFNSVSYQESSFKELIEYFNIFIIIVVLLIAEWFFRRYLGSY